MVTAKVDCGKESLPSNSTCFCSLTVIAAAC
jgi:hypothetical protein